LRGGEKTALEDTLFLVLYWTGPIGLGVFLAGLGYLIQSVARAERIGKKSEETKQKET